MTGAKDLVVLPLLTNSSSLTITGPTLANVQEETKKRPRRRVAAVCHDCHYVSTWAALHPNAVRRQKT